MKSETKHLDSVINQKEKDVSIDTTKLEESKSVSAQLADIFKKIDKKNDGDLRTLLHKRLLFWGYDMLMRRQYRKVVREKNTAGIMSLPCTCFKRNALLNYLLSTPLNQAGQVISFKDRIICEAYFKQINEGDKINMLTHENHEHQKIQDHFANNESVDFHSYLRTLCPSCKLISLRAKYFTYKSSMDDILLQ